LTTHFVTPGDKPIQENSKYKLQEEKITYNLWTFITQVKKCLRFWIWILTTNTTNFYKVAGKRVSGQGSTYFNELVPKTQLY